MQIAFMKDLKIYYKMFYERHVDAMTTILTKLNATVVLLLFLD